MKNEHICFFNCTRAWGGGEEWHFSMARTLHKDEYNVLVVAHPDGLLAEKCRQEGIPVTFFKVSNLSFLNPFKLIRLVSLFKKQKTTNLLINSSPDLKLAGIAGKIAGIRQILYRRGLAAHVKNSFLNRFLFGKILDRVITNSAATRIKLLEGNISLISPEKISIIYNGLDIRSYDQKERFFSFERVGDEIIIGSMGRMVEQKNQESLIDLAVRLKEQSFNFKLLLAGVGPLEEQLKNRVKEVGLEDCFIFCGFINDTKGFMETIDIFVLPSLWEGFGFVLIEAMASSKPVVAFDISSNPEVVENEKSGLLAKTGDMGELTDHVIRLIRDPRLRHSMGLAGRKRVEELFSFERGKEELVRLLDVGESELE